MTTEKELSPRTSWAALGCALAALTAACSSATGPGSGLTHPAGIVVTPAPLVSARPFAVAISAMDVAYVGHQDIPYLQRTALPDITFGDSVRVGSDPTDIAFNAAGTLAFVTNQFSSNVGVIDVAIGVTTDSIGVRGNPFRIVVSPSGTTVFVSSNDDSVYAIAVSSKSVLHRWGFNSAVNGLAVTPNGGTLYVSSIGGRLYKLNTNGTGVIDSVDIGGVLQDVALSPDGEELYLANESGSLEVRDPASLAFRDSVAGASGAFGLKPTPDGKQLYATYPAAGLIRIIDRATRVVEPILTVGGTPRRIAFGQHGAVALIPNESGFVTVVR